MKNSLLLMLLLSSTNAIPASYKWVDDHNQTHYSEQPPGNNKKAKLLPSTSSSNANDAVASSAPVAPKTIAEREADLKKTKLAKKEESDKAAQKQAYVDALKANCSAAQKNLVALQNGIRLIEIDANGERSFLSDEQRQQRIAIAQQDIKDSCK